MSTASGRNKEPGIPYQPRRTKSNVNVSHRSPLGEFFILSGALFLFLALAYGLLGWALNFVIPRVPASFETSMGSLLLERWASKQTASDETKRFQGIADKLSKKIPDNPFPIKVFVISTKDKPNALALPGGTILVFSSLAEILKTEGAAAMLLGHELGHFANRHHLKGFGRSLLFSLFTTFLLGQDAALSQGMQAGLAQIEVRHSRHQEKEADLYALDLLAQTYGHVTGARELFNILNESEENQVLAGFFDTHPAPERRLAYLNQRILERGYLAEDTSRDEKVKMFSITDS